MLLDNMTTLLQTIKAGTPSATTLVASVINFGFDSMPPACAAFNAALPALVAAAAQGGQKAVFVDVNKRSNWCTENGWPCTGVHPTTGGYMCVIVVKNGARKPFFLCPHPYCKQGHGHGLVRGARSVAAPARSPARASRLRGALGLRAPLKKKNACSFFHPPHPRLPHSLSTNGP